MVTKFYCVTMCSLKQFICSYPCTTIFVKLGLLRIGLHLFFREVADLVLVVRIKLFQKSRKKYIFTMGKKIINCISVNKKAFLLGGVGVQVKEKKRCSLFHVSHEFFDGVDYRLFFRIGVSVASVKILA